MSASRNRNGHIYFLRSPEQKAIKVGFAVNFFSRLPSLQSGNPNKLELFTLVPADSDAEHVFHHVMRPHRIAREWYPDDTLLYCIGSELMELWGDEVVDKAGWDTWPVTGDEYTNPAGIYLTASAFRKCLPTIIRDFFDMTDDEKAEIDDLPPNHWAEQPPRRRALAATGVHGERR